jgi:hypothetical protein
MSSVGRAPTCRRDGGTVYPNKPASIGADTQITGRVTDVRSSNCTSTLAASRSVVEP